MSPAFRMTTNGIPVVPGIVPGGSSPNGHYVGLAVVQTALEFGWADTMAAGAAETYDEHYADEGWPHADHWHDIVDDAEKWLNEHTTGGLWLWTSGDFRLVATTECDKCGETIDRDDPGTCPDHPWWTD